MVREWVPQLMVTAHGSKLAGSQVIERQVDGAAPGVARPGGHISLLEHLGSVDIRVVAQLLPDILRLFRPAQKAVHGALGAIPIPEQQAEAKGRRPFPRTLQGRAQSPRAD